MPIVHPATRERPLRVSLRLPALVRAGVDAVLTPYAERVRVLPTDATNLADLEADVENVGLRAAALLPRPRRRHLPRIALSWDAGAGAAATGHELGVARVLALDVSALDLVVAIEQAHRQSLTRAPQVPATPTTEADLSPREAEIVDLICRGLSNVEVSQHLFLSINSVKTYIRSAYRKMGVERRSQAVLWGLGRGFGRSGGDASDALTRSPA